MRTSILSIALSAILFTACNTDTASNQINVRDSSTNSESNSAVNPASPSIEILVADYLEIKNALTKDNGKSAASAAGKLAATFKAFDPASLSKEQAGVFEDIKADAVEHAEHIAGNAGLIAHQREHFETLSKDLYDLVKEMGAEQKLYYTNCPMYNDNKGANWLSETKEIQNPYLGQAMLTCGSVKEELN